MICYDKIWWLEVLYSYRILILYEKWYIKSIKKVSKIVKGSDER